MTGRALGLATLLLLAGCLSDDPAPAPEPAAPQLQGWVLDERLAPVVDARVHLVGLGVESTVSPDGQYVLELPRGAEVVVLVEATGFRPQSRSVGAASGEQAWANFTLERIPVADPYWTVTTHTGTVRCGFVAVVAEDPARPHEHQGVRCSQALNDTSNQWVYTIPTNTTGVVVEVAWTPQSELAQALVLRITSQGSGEVLAFLEGTSVLRVQLSSIKVAQELAAGHTSVLMTLEPGAGQGDHEHGAAGAFLEQQVDLYATAFFNGPVDPDYSISRPQ